MLQSEGYPIILGGDFNDWNCALSSILANNLGFREAFLELNRGHAKTFPAFWPRLKLDRIYFWNCSVTQVMVLHQPRYRMSDHLPIYSEFLIKPFD